MSKGYITIAQNTDTTDYLEQAYALAMSLKLTQSKVNKLTVCVDESTKKQMQIKHYEMFDSVVDIPWGDAAKSSDWKIHNKWKYYYMSPYDETVILDTDMLFPTDVSYWWDIMCERDVWATTNVRTYRGEIVQSDYYRKYFTLNNLPNVYTAFMYFKKSDLAAELFAMVEIIFQHWQRFFYKYMPEGKPEWLSGDVAFALAMQILGIEHLCTKDNVTDMPTFVHMKSHVQNITGVNIDEQWNESLPTYFNSYDNFKVHNFAQHFPFHYVEKSWLTKEIILSMESKL